MTNAQVQAVADALALLRRSRQDRDPDPTAALALQTRAEVVLARLLAAHAREAFAQGLQPGDRGEVAGHE